MYKGVFSFNFQDNNFIQKGLFGLAKNCKTENAALNPNRSSDISIGYQIQFNNSILSQWNYILHSHHFHHLFKSKPIPTPKIFTNEVISFKGGRGSYQVDFHFFVVSNSNRGECQLSGCTIVCTILITLARNNIFSFRKKFLVADILLNLRKQKKRKNLPRTPYDKHIKTNT